MKKLLSLLFLVSLIFGSATIHGTRTPWLQECLDTIESYSPYLHYDHGDCGSENYPSDLKKLTENVTNTSISALSRWEFYILTKGVIKAARIIPSFLFVGPVFIKSSEAEEHAFVKQEIQRLNRQLSIVQERISRLIDMHVDGAIDAQIYHMKLEEYKKMMTTMELSLERYWKLAEGLKKYS